MYDDEDEDNSQIPPQPEGAHPKDELIYDKKGWGVYKNGEFQPEYGLEDVPAKQYLKISARLGILTRYDLQSKYGYSVRATRHLIYGRPSTRRPAIPAPKKPEKYLMPKRPRGRPKKYSATEPAPTPKRPPGRPRKYPRPE